MANDIGFHAFIAKCSTYPPSLDLPSTLLGDQRSTKILDQDHADLEMAFFKALQNLIPGISKGRIPT